MKHSKEVIESLKSVQNHKRVLAAKKGMAGLLTCTTLLGKLDNYVDILATVDDGAEGDKECLLLKQSIKALQVQCSANPQNTTYYLSDILNVIIPQVCTIVKMRASYIDALGIPSIFTL